MTCSLRFAYGVVRLVIPWFATEPRGDRMADVRKAEYEEQASPLTEQWPYLRFLGLGAGWAWIWLC